MQAILPYLYAFLVGGAFCLIGQVLIDRTKLTTARILSGYVVAGVLLEALGWYQHSQQALLGHRFLHPAGQQTAKAGQRHRCPCPGKID